MGEGDIGSCHGEAERSWVTLEWYVYPVYSEAGTYGFGPIAARGSIQRGSVSFSSYP